MGQVMSKFINDKLFKTVIMKMVKKYPNDMILGEKIRQWVIEEKSKAEDKDE